MNDRIEQHSARRARTRRRRAVLGLIVAVGLVGIVMVQRHGGPRHVAQRLHDIIWIAAGAGDSRLTDKHGTQVIEKEIRSDMLDRSLLQIVILPKGYSESDHRPLLVFFHGRGSSPKTLRNDAMIQALDSAGENAPVLLLANGGDHSYYHDREDKRWGSYVLKELVPATVRKYSLDPDRVAFAGISMGGYGALQLTIST